MQVRLDTPYSLAELRLVGSELVRLGVLHAEELLPDASLQQLSIDFFDLNQLLEPAFARSIVSYSNDARKGWFDQSETSYFYEWFALQLLRGCPLRAYAPTCREDPDAPVGSEQLLLRAGAHGVVVDYQPLNHPELIAALVGAVNHLLGQHGLAVAYYELASRDEAAWFILLTPGQYAHLLSQRRLHFAHVSYPEIDAWRSTLRVEDLLF